MRASKQTLGFSPTEILVVIVVLGILSAIIVPQFSRAGDHYTSAGSTLQTLRRQIDGFKADHGGIPPQTAALWALLMSRSSTAETATACPAGTVFGPYLKTPPINPVNGLSSVSTVSGPDASAGWYYSWTPDGSFTLQPRDVDGTIITSW